MKLDPFYIFGLAMLIGTVGYVLYLIWRVQKYIAVSRRGRDQDAKWWSKAISNPEGPVRPTEEYVQKVKKQIIDEEGNRKMNPWIKRAVVPLLIVGILLAVQFGGVYDFGSVFQEPPPSQKTVYSIAFYVMGVVASWTNLTDCVDGTVVTGIVGRYVDSSSYTTILFDTQWNDTRGWYEFRLTDSESCLGLGIYHIESYKLIDVTVEPPKTQP